MDLRLCERQVRHVGGCVMLRDRIAALVASASPDTLVPVRWLGELLAADDGAPEQQPADMPSVVDLSVTEVAARFRKGPSTVRGWCKSGELAGAYLLHGREWRIPLTAIDALQRAQASKHATLTTSKPVQVADLGAWRAHLPRSVAP